MVECRFRQTAAKLAFSESMAVDQAAADTRPKRRPCPVSLPYRPSRSPFSRPPTPPCRSLEARRGAMRSQLPALTRRVLSAALPGIAPLATVAGGSACCGVAGSRGVASHTCSGGGWSCDRRHQGEPAGWAEYGQEFSHHAVDSSAPHLYSLHASEWQQQHYLLSVASRRAAAESEAEAGVGDRIAPIEVSRQPGHRLITAYVHLQTKLLLCQHSTCRSLNAPRVLSTQAPPLHQPTAPAAAGGQRCVRGSQPCLTAADDKPVRGRGGRCRGAALCSVRASVRARLL